MERRKKGFKPAAIATGMVLFMLVGAAIGLADFVLTANINGNTVNYSVFGAMPDADYTVVIKHDETGESNPYEEHSNEEGKFSGSGTPGNSPIEAGDSVTITVSDEDGKTVASITLRTRCKAPWWAYTGLGTLIYWAT